MATSGTKAKARLTVEDILAKCKILEQEYDILGGTIKIRGITKDMQQQARKRAMHGGEVDADKVELELFRAGVTEPELSEEQAMALKAQMPAGDFDSILTKILQLSGIITVEERQEVAKFFRN